MCSEGIEGKYGVEIEDRVVEDEGECLREGS